MKQSNTIDKIRGCLIGGAAGDALGYAIEFDRLRAIRKAYGKPGITEYEINYQTGTAVISDDTQMTLFTAEGIMAAMEAGVTAPADRRLYRYVHNAYLDWYETQEGTPVTRPVGNVPVSELKNVPELNVRRAPGITCLNALGSPEERDLYNPINNSKGCGTIMRVAPVGLLYPDASLEAIVEMAAEISAITHGHPLGCFPSGIFAAIIQQAVYGEEVTPLITMTEKAVTAARNLYGKSDYWDDLESMIDKTISLAVGDRDDDKNIKELGEGWVAEEALFVALYCAIRYEHDLSAGLIASVNHDGDSDSTGEIAGNILGALCGFDAIDDKWKEKLELKDLILRMADRIELCSKKIQQAR